jgi:hypothetical protein
VQIGATSSASGVLASAFTLSGKLTIVVTNQDDADVVAHIDLGGFIGSQSFSAVRTSDHEGLLPLNPISASGGSLAIPLKGRSVTTLYQ